MGPSVEEQVERLQKVSEKLPLRLLEAHDFQVVLMMFAGDWALASRTDDEYDALNGMHLEKEAMSLEEAVAFVQGVRSLS